MKRVFCFVLVLSIILLSAGCNTEFISSEISDKTSQILEIIDSVVKQEEVQSLEFSDDYNFPPEYDSCYSVLNKKQKGIYKQLFAASEQMPEGFIRVSDYYENVMADIALAYCAMLNDYVDIFWMPNTYILGETTSNGKKVAAVAFKISNEKNKNDYILAKDERDSMRKKLNDTVAGIVSQTTQINGEYEKEKFINDYICANTEYVLEGDLVHTAYGSLVLGEALCEGYSRAFKLLCNKVGIECELVSGTAGDEAHMWNVAEIDGEYAYVDVTWNDRDDGFDYLYFNLNYNQLMFDHILSPVFSALTSDKLKDNASFNFNTYSCNYSGNSYYIKNGYVLGGNFAAVAARVILEQSAKGLNYAVFLVENERLSSTLAVEDTSMINDIQLRLRRITIDSYLLQRDILILHFN